MNTRFALVFLVGLGFAIPAWGDDAPPVAPAAGNAQAELAPWVKAQATLDAAGADLDNGGIRALAPHVDAFEQALAGQDATYDGGNPDEIVLLTDGPIETAAVTAAVAKAVPNKKAVVVHNPYPLMAFYLASYYNELGRFDDSLRVLDKELAADQGTLGLSRSLMVSERAVALAQLHRFPEALAAYEEGLKLEVVDDKDRARMHRGRGYVLTELGRLDEAEAAYQESLKLDPGNRIALGELDYIAKLRAGADMVPGQTVLPGEKTN